MAAPGRMTIAAACLVWALALATTALAWMSPNPKQDDSGKLNISATGAMSIDNSRGEAAILKAPPLAPGATAVGKVTIRNHGKPGNLVLARRNLLETPAASGAVLGEVLKLRILNVAGGAKTVVYSGPLVTMPPLRLGLLPAGAKRRFRFAARLPEPGPVDNALMGARVRFDYRWRLSPPRP
jgi:hypothetical protein